MSDEPVGYGRPPKHSRYQKGYSGNPRGRAKGSKNLATDIVEELGERISIREGDKVKRVTKQRAAVKALTSRSVKGDAKAAAMLFERRERADERAEANAREIRNSTENDAIVERWLASLGVSNDSTGS